MSRRNTSPAAQQRQLRDQILGYFLIFTFGVIPTLIQWIFGTAFADYRGDNLTILGNTAPALSVIALTAMVVGVWMARAQTLYTALAGASLYSAAGFGVLALEAIGGASSTLGWWPESSSGRPFLFVLSLWFHLHGLLLLAGAASIPFVFALALRGRRYRFANPFRRKAAPIVVPTDERPSDSRLEATRPKLKLDDLAGMEELKAQLRAFSKPFAEYHRRKATISDINGLLLSGPPGNGKSVFPEALAGELGFNFLKVSVQDLTSKWINESPTRIQQAFADAVAAEPCVLFLDEIDAIGRDRMAAGGAGHGEDIKVVDTLLTEVDRIRKHRVLLIASTNHPDTLDRALVRDGRFDRKIEIPLPDLAARTGVLRSMLAKHKIQVHDACIHAAARLWERRSVAFIENVAKRVRENAAATGEGRADIADLKAAAKAVSRREGALPKTGAKLSELTLPASLRREALSIVHRLRNWESLADRGATPPRGILLYGPPGTGKTNLVRGIARELGDWHVFEVKTAAILSDPRCFQETLELAAEHRPAFVFIDEADDLLKDRALSPSAIATSEILKAMDGLMGSVPELVFIAATNSPEAIDAAALRGGRFSEKLLVDLLRGQDLLEFARSELQRRRGVFLDKDLTAAWITHAAVEIAPADFIAVMDRAINTVVAEFPLRPVGRTDFVEAMEAVTGRDLGDM
jgi:transitional endoplasmic reticulum ATPase